MSIDNEEAERLIREKNQKEDFEGWRDRVIPFLEEGDDDYSICQDAFFAGKRFHQSKIDELQKELNKKSIELVGWKMGNNLDNEIIGVIHQKTINENKILLLKNSELESALANFIEWIDRIEGSTVYLKKFHSDGMYNDSTFAYAFLVANSLLEKYKCSKN